MSDTERQRFFQACRSIVELHMGKLPERPSYVVTVYMDGQRVFSLNAYCIEQARLMQASSELLGYYAEIARINRPGADDGVDDA